MTLRYNLGLCIALQLAGGYYGFRLASSSNIRHTGGSGDGSGDAKRLQRGKNQYRPLHAGTADAATIVTNSMAPQVFASGYSTQSDLVQALQEATRMATLQLPPPSSAHGGGMIDVAWVYVSSLYDGGLHAPAVTVVPTLLAAAATLNYDIQHLIGCSVWGCISSNTVQRPQAQAVCETVEYESVPAVSVVLAQLPDVQVATLQVATADVPEGDGGPRPSKAEWQRQMRLHPTSSARTTPNTSATTPPPIFWLLPSPGLAPRLDDLLQGLATHFPQSQTVGALSSTVSSLSRAKLYCYSRGHDDPQATSCCYTDGCVGVMLQGDLVLETWTAQGAKPVGGIYQILQGEESTIRVIQLDATATEALQQDNGDNDDDDDEEDEETTPPLDAKEQLARTYAKAQIPKPPLAEANFIMRSLSDDDQAFMRRQLLIGLEQGGGVGRTASELQRLASGHGHRFTVHPVASAGMKDGSCTLPLGKVQISPGTRMRYFVRDARFARREIEALWLGYKKRALNAQFGVVEENYNDDSDSTKKSFTPTACFVIPTLDRGAKFFQGSSSYESTSATTVLSGVPCVAGFFANGVIGLMSGTATTAANKDPKTPLPPPPPSTGLQGSASGYTLFGSPSGRPIYSPAQAAADQAARQEQEALERAEAQQAAADEVKREYRVSQKQQSTSSTQRAPRDEQGELILKRREVHAGRTMTVSTVEWSVAEKSAQPTSVLEGFMWDKETEVDRFRERVPLANLVSQCRLAATDPTVPRPRGFVQALRNAGAGFFIIPECKRTEPSAGSLRKRYDIAKLVRDFTKAGAPAISVNCDAVLFGGTLDDVTVARKEAAQAAAEQAWEDGVPVPPILASDLLLYPYQLYKLRLAGADAVHIIVGALARKDLAYLLKIANSLQIQTFVTVTSTVQLHAMAEIEPGLIHGVIVSNRQLEDYSHDTSGQQALDLLQSKAMHAFRQQHGDDIVVLAEGRIGLISSSSSSDASMSYLQQLHHAGANGAIVGGALAVDETAAAILQAMQTA